VLEMPLLLTIFIIGKINIITVISMYLELKSVHIKKEKVLCGKNERKDKKILFLDFFCFYF
jgi:hypothetical protein